MLTWVYLDGSGREVGRSERFGDRETAESWLSHSWEELRHREVEEVELFDLAASASVYRMSLSDEAAPE